MNTPTVHCQVCARPIKAAKGVIAHHGYKRPGNGWQTASCFGAKHVPYEVGHDALDRWIAWLVSAIPARKAQLDELVANPPESFEIRKLDAWGRLRAGYPKTVTRPEGFTGTSPRDSRFDSYPSEFHDRAYKHRTAIKEMEETLAYASARRIAWTAQA